MVFKSSVLILFRAWLAKIKLVFFWNINAKMLRSCEAVTPTQKYPSWQSYRWRTRTNTPDSTWQGLISPKTSQIQSGLRLNPSTNEWVQRACAERTDAPQKTDFPRAPSFKHAPFTSGANTFIREAGSVAEAQTRLAKAPTSHRAALALGVKTTLFFHSLQTEKEIRNIPLVNMIFKKPRYKYREGAKINDGAPQWGCGSVHLHDNRGTGGQNRERGAKKKRKKKRNDIHRLNMPSKK